MRRKLLLKAFFKSIGRKKRFRKFFRFKLIRRLKTYKKKYLIGLKKRKGFFINNVDLLNIQVPFNVSSFKLKKFLLSGFRLRKSINCIKFLKYHYKKSKKKAYDYRLHFWKYSQKNRNNFSYYADKGILVSTLKRKQKFIFFKRNKFLQWYRLLPLLRFKLRFHSSIFSLMPISRKYNVCKFKYFLFYGRYHYGFSKLSFNNLARCFRLMFF